MVLANEVDDRGSMPEVLSGDQRVILHGVSWDEYEKLCELFAERSGVRMTYLQGAEARDGSRPRLDRESHGCP